MHVDLIRDLEVLLGHSFRERAFLDNALSHSSIKTEERPSNERLEFLGDSVLGLIVSDALYRRFPTDDEGTLTRIKSHAVSRATLQRVATAMGLERYIMVGKGVAKREIPASLLGNLFEAIVGAIYLDAGLASSRKFVLRHLDVVIDEIVEDRAERNYKSLFQHYCQRELGGVPTYRVLRETGPAHGRAFEVAVQVNSKEYGRARAGSKKEAEQGAARAAMIHFRQIQERASYPARGAGTILRVGPEAAAKKKRRRRGGRKAASEEREAVAVQEESKAQPKKPEESGRRKRGSRGGRRRGAAAAATESKPSEAAAPKKDAASGVRRTKKTKKSGAKESASKKTAEKKTGKKKPSRRRRPAPRDTGAESRA
ncbi:MAG: ribonuclease III [Planctomycetota bacterium]|jgi:ribonuclease-3